MWLESILTANPVLAIAVFIVIAVLDYIMTIRNTRVYRSTEVSSRLRFKGSTEITPLLQDTVDRMNLFNPRFLLVLIARLIPLAAAWYWAARTGNPYFFSVIYGAAVISSLLANMRHIENAIWYRAIQRLGPDEVFHSEQPRWLYLQSSALNRLLLGMLFLLAFALTGSFMLMGGAFACLGIATQQWIFAKREKRSPLPAE